jgi:hypothetical protein
MTTPTDPDLSPSTEGPRWARESDGVEFERVAFFNDAVFAIAMTLLIVAVAVPALHDSTRASDLLGALNDKSAEFVAIAVWFLSLPGEALLDRYKPASFDAAFGVTARRRPPS